MKKKINQDPNETQPKSEKQKEIVASQPVQIQVVEGSKKKSAAGKIDAELPSGMLKDDLSADKAEVKTKLKEARKFYRYTKKLLKKSKKIFKKSSKKKDPNLYEIVKFNFSEAKRRRKEQKVHLKDLKKALKEI